MIEAELIAQLDCAERGYDTKFTITDDGMADWAIRKIADDVHEFERIKAIADSRIMELQIQIEQERQKMESRTSFLRGHLHTYFESVPHKKTQTTESYKLLSGSLVKKVATQKIVRPDDADLIKYLRENGQGHLIEISEKPAWGEFKKTLQIMDGKVVDTATGEVIDGITVEDVPESFDIKL